MPVPTAVTNFVRSPNRRNATVLVARLRSRGLFPFGPRSQPAQPHELTPPTPGAEIAVYFADDPRRLYQLEQWLPVLERLDERRRVLLVFRSLQSLRTIRPKTSLPTVCARRLADLMHLYDASDFKVAIYVNNGVSNFQSLGVSTMLHVHVNHGESDKVCMVSNQAKAYDRVFVAGEAAIRRHRAALIDFDDRKLVPVGRPQLDLTFRPPLPSSSRRTVLYAPTWEGENSFNNYTSVDRFGVAIVRQLLALDDVRVVYRPHPRVATSTEPAMTLAHEEILAMIERAREQDPAAGHTAVSDGSILAVFGQCDAMVTDVSSVGLDFLYLRNDRPIFLTDRRDDRAALLADAPISAAADIVDSTTIERFGATVAARLLGDELGPRRAELRRYYFGELAPGESTERFLAAVEEVLAERDRLLAQQPEHHVPLGAAVAAVGVSEDSASEVAEVAAARRQEPAP